MPLYTFRCEACDNTQDVLRPMTDITPPQECEECGRESFKRVYHPTFVAEVVHIDYDKIRRDDAICEATPGLTRATKHEIEMQEHNWAETKRKREKKEFDDLVKTGEQIYADASRGKIDTRPKTPREKVKVNA